jgi:hypothetical protein
LCQSIYNSEYNFLPQGIKMLVIYVVNMLKTKTSEPQKRERKDELIE